MALGAVALAVALPTLLLTAFRSSDASPGATDRPRAPIAPASQRRPSFASARAQRRALQRLLRLDLPIYCAGSGGRYVALTFDDGPSPYTPELLRVLDEGGARATFFVVGANMASPKLAEYARRYAEAGVVANHTYTHPRLTDLSASDVAAEIGNAQRAIEKATGRRITLFRPPYAAQSSAISSVTRQHGLVRILWNTDSRDWTGQGWDKTADYAVRGLEPGSIILLHDTRPGTIKALRYVILPELQRRGLRSVTLPELFALDPPSVDQLRADTARGACSHQHD